MYVCMYYIFSLGCFEFVKLRNLVFSQLSHSEHFL